MSDFPSRSTANPMSELIIHGYAVKTLESKETRASKEITVTHNSVFAAHRLQCRMTIHKVDIRHFVLPFVRNRDVIAALGEVARKYCSHASSADDSDSHVD